MHRMNTTRVDALAEARQALRGMELAIRKARFNRGGTPAEKTSQQKARRLPTLRGRDVRRAY